MNSFYQQQWEHRLTLAIIVFSLSLFTQSTMAVESEQVEIKAWIGDVNNKQATVQLAPSEQVIMTIELATSRWFTAGAQVHIVDQPNLIMMQRNPFGSNSTLRRDGETWSIQQLELTLYPTQSGHYQLPPIAVDVSYSVAGQGNATRRLYTPSFSFEARLPDGRLNPELSWFSASKVQAQQQWQIHRQDPQSEQLKVGDSVTRKLTLSATDSLSIFLPSMLDNYVSEHYANYVAPVQLSDTQQRGHYLSNRVEQQTIVLNNGGEFIMPSITVNWWNAKENRLEKIELDARQFKVQHTFLSWLNRYGLALIIGLSALVVVCILLGIGLRRLKKRGQLKSVTFVKALLGNNAPVVRQLVYQRCLEEHNQLRLTSLDTRPKWQKQALIFQGQARVPKSVAFYVWRALSQVKTQTYWHFSLGPLKGLPKERPHQHDKM